MSHLHFCPCGSGHLWDCTGEALRPFDSEPTPCVCPACELLLGGGDHSGCCAEIEHLHCPIHLRTHLIASGYDPDNLPDPGSELSILSLISDEEGYPVVGWCRRCLRSFKSDEEFRTHQGDLFNNCSAFAELRRDKRVINLLEALGEWIDEGTDEIEF